MFEPLLPWRYLARYGSVGLNMAIRVREDPTFRLIEKVIRVLGSQVLAGGQAATPLRRGDIPPGRRIAEVETDPPGLVPELQNGRARRCRPRAVDQR